MSSIGSSTYNFIATQTVGTATPSITFNNIPQNYTDLVLVIHMAVASNPGFCTVQVGTGGTVDTASNYSGVTMGGINTSAVTSYHNTSETYFNSNPNNQLNTGYNTPITFHFMNYASTNMYKTVLSRTSDIQNNSSEVNAQAQLWISYNPITTMKVAVSSGVNINVGSTVTLYGIKAADITSIIPTKAIGGDLITSDGTYTYHAFKSTGLFTPAQSLTCDVLIVAGGGSYNSSARFSGGGGAGGLLGLTSQSLTGGTGYAITVGAGGAISSTASATDGTSSSFFSSTAVGGGGGGVEGNTNGRSGGSGGGGAGTASVSAGSGGANTSGQGNTGGAGSTSVRAGGGGGGAGGAGGAYSGGRAGVGGVGSSAYSSWGLATGYGHNVSGTVYFAGGGGGGAYDYSDGLVDAGLGGNGGGGAGGNYNGGGGNATHAGSSGTINTGGGGGGSGWPGNSADGGAGGSGIVIVRYLS
jgi:hypothetical protein